MYKLPFLEREPPFSTVRYLENIFSETYDVSKTKFERVDFELFKLCLGTKGTQFNTIHIATEHSLISTKKNSKI